MSEKIAKFRIGMDLLMQLFHSSPQTEALEEAWRLHSHQLLDYLWILMYTPVPFPSELPG